MMSARNNYIISIAFLLPFASLLIWHASYYFPFIADDALISLRYAHRLLEGHGLNWSAGKPVEGYSNLLWILAIAALGKLGLDLIDAARILGAFGMIVIMWCVLHYYFNKARFHITWLPIAVALLYLAAAAPIAVWVVGGLEQPLYGALLAASIVLMYAMIESENSGKRQVVYLSLVLGLLCLTRPDGPIFTIASAASLLFIGWLYRKNHKKSKNLLVSIPIIIVVPLIFYLGQMIFRLYYYGEFVPNTALVKLAPTQHYFNKGLEYWKEGIMAQSPLSFIALFSLGAILFTKNRAKGVYLLAILLLWSAYIVFIGGDIFPAFRHHIPLIIVFAFSLAEGIYLGINRLMKLSSKKYYYLFAICCFIPLPYYADSQFDNPQHKRAISERWEWIGKDVGLLLKSAFSEQQPLLAVTAAGCLPYWSELPALDMLGLNDYYLPRNRPANFGSGYLGHELGDGAYVLRRNPDIITFGVGAPPAFRSGYEMNNMPEFHQRYIPIKIRTANNHRQLIYFNRYSKKIGIKESSSRIVIPGFLFNSRDYIAYLNEENKLVTQLRPGRHPLQVTFESPSQQNWSIDVQSPDADKISSKLCRKKRSFTIILSSESREPIEIQEVILTTHSENTPDSSTLDSAQSLLCPGHIQFREISRQPKKDGIRWNASGNIVIAQYDSLKISLNREDITGNTLELSLDNNDDYAVIFGNNDKEIWQGKITASRKNNGLVSYQLPLPADVDFSKVDQIEIKPLSGDGKYSLGHIRFLQK